MHGGRIDRQAPNTLRVADCFGRSAVEWHRLRDAFLFWKHRWRQRGIRGNSSKTRVERNRLRCHVRMSSEIIQTGYSLYNQKDESLSFNWTTIGCKWSRVFLGCGVTESPWILSSSSSPSSCFVSSPSTDFECPTSSVSARWYDYW